MSHDPERQSRQRSALGKPVFIVLVASIVLAGVFLFAMMSLTREEPLQPGIAGGPLVSDDEVTLEENAPPVDRTLLPTPERNEPLTEQVDIDTGSGTEAESASGTGGETASDTAPGENAPSRVQ